jgi:ppGpp synthetase/RelA/SpoT-type nucleotidyltranferase
MHRRYWKELEEVDKYLDRSKRRPTYKEFQRQIKQTLLGLTALSAIAPSISDVYTREDRNKDEPLKTNKKIALKLYKWRHSDTSPRSTTVSDVHDIIGLSVLCPYPSDTDIVKQYLVKHKFDHFSIARRDVRFLDPKDNKGYRAYHVVCNGRGRFAGLRGEIQIKTLINESWGMKTHDLTYKPPGDIDRRLNMNMEKLTSILQLLDEQSEIVKDLIVQAWSMDKNRREVAQQQLLMHLGSLKDKKIRAITSYWKVHQADFSTSELLSKSHRKIDDMITEYLEESGSNADICRVACLYATSRPNRDKNDWALGIIDNWINSIEKDGDRFKALMFRSIANMALGEYEESIAHGREVLQLAKASKDPQLLTQAITNLAYFLAEGYYHRIFDESLGGGKIDRAYSEDRRMEALKLIKTVDPTDPLGKIAVLDTKGAVLIACGRSEGDVRRGMTLCNQAAALARGTVYAARTLAFHALHERRAFRRLLEPDLSA